MSFFDRLSVRGRHGAETDNASRWPGIMSPWWLCSSLFIATLFSSSALSDALGLMDAHETEISMEAGDGGESLVDWQSDVDPRFVLDGSLFEIEPSASAPRYPEMESCHPFEDQEPGVMCPQ